MNQKSYIMSLVFLFVVAIGYSSLPVDKLKMVYSDYAVEFPKSKVFIKTDKDIYAAGEKLWFKAEVYNCLTERATAEKDLMVMIVKEDGEVIADNTYLINAGLVTDQLTIPSWSPEGNAFVVAYTANAQKVNEASLVAVVPIVINTFDKNDYLMDIAIEDRVYDPGDEIKMDVELHALSNTNDNEKIQIALFDYHKGIFSMKENIVVGSEKSFAFKLPSKIEDGLYLEVKTCGKNKISHRIPVRTSNDPIKISFYPEGGDLLTNVVQRIVYRATDPFGKPANVAGIVYDPQGNEVGVGKIMKDGYGLINLMPMPNQSYIFKLNSEYGEDQKYEMPQAVLDGTSLSMVKIDDNLLRLAINNTGNRIGEKQKIVAYKEGQVLMVYEFVAQQKSALKIPTHELPEGVLKFVVLDEQEHILSERMVYNTLHRDIDIDISAEVGKPDNNGEVDLIIDAQKFIEKFGASWADIKVVDEQNLYQVSTSQNHSFLQYPLLTPTPKTVLDIFLTNLELIGNDYRFYRMQDLLDRVDYLNNKAKIRTLSGVVSDKSGCRIPNATVMVDHPNAPSLLSTKTNESGWFVFENISKSKGMMVKAINESGKKTYLVHLDRSFDENLEEIMLIESFKRKQIYSIDKTPEYYTTNYDLLKKVGSETRSRRQAKVTNTQRMLQSGSSILDVVRMIKPFTLHGSMIVFNGTSNSFMSQQGALIVIDGIKMGTGIGAFDRVNPHEVVSINVSTDPADVQKYTGLNSIGVIEVRTQGSYGSIDRKRKPEEHISTFDTSDFSKNIWNYQTTLLWNPHTKIPDDGELKLKMKTSNIQSNFKIKIDVVSHEGVRQQYETEFSTIKTKHQE